MHSKTISSTGNATMVLIPRKFFVIFDRFACTLSWFCLHYKLSASPLAPFEVSKSELHKLGGGKGEVVGALGTHGVISSCLLTRKNISTWLVSENLTFASFMAILEMSCIALSFGETLVTWILIQNHRYWLVKICVKVGLKLIRNWSNNEKRNSSDQIWTNFVTRDRVKIKVFEMFLHWFSKYCARMNSK